MAIAPPLILVVYYFVDPINTAALFTTFFGQVLLSLALVLNVMAYVWARFILTPGYLMNQQDQNSMPMPIDQLTASALP